jgi:hypothetical protein
MKKTNCCTGVVFAYDFETKPMAMRKVSPVLKYNTGSQVGGGGGPHSNVESEKQSFVRLKKKLEHLLLTIFL